MLWQRTPADMSGYLNMPEKTREVLTADGWYISGDVFRRDADGAYFFVGRTDDMFVCGGENVFPGEVEHLLERHPDIAAGVRRAGARRDQGREAGCLRRGESRQQADGGRHQALRARRTAPRTSIRAGYVSSMRCRSPGPNKVDRKALKQKAAALWQATA